MLDDQTTCGFVGETWTQGHSQRTDFAFITRFYTKSNGIESYESNGSAQHWVLRKSWLLIISLSKILRRDLQSRIKMFLLRSLHFERNLPIANYINIHVLVAQATYCSNFEALSLDDGLHRLRTRCPPHKNRRRQLKSNVRNWWQSIFSSLWKALELQLHYLLQHDIHMRWSLWMKTLTLWRKNIYWKTQWDIKVWLFSHFLAYTTFFHGVVVRV